MQSVGSAEYSYIHERTSNIVRVKRAMDASGGGGVDHLTTLCAVPQRDNTRHIHRDIIHTWHSLDGKSIIL